MYNVIKPVRFNSPNTCSYFIYEEILKLTTNVVKRKLWNNPFKFQFFIDIFMQHADKFTRFVPRKVQIII